MIIYQYLIDPLCHLNIESKYYSSIMKELIAICKVIIFVVILIIALNIFIKFLSRIQRYLLVSNNINREHFYNLNYLCRFNDNKLKNGVNRAGLAYLDTQPSSSQFSPGTAWSQENCPQFRHFQVISSSASLFDKFIYLQIRLMDQINWQLKEKILSGSYSNGLFRLLKGGPTTLFTRWSRVVSPMNAQIMNGFLFGAASDDPQLKEAMKVLGLSHLFAASGANVSLVLSLFGHFRGWPRKWRFVSRVGTVVSYWLLAGAGVSLSRAVLMAILGFLARDLVLRQVSNLRILSLLAILVAIFVPAWLESLSFQLSAAATAALLFAASLRSPTIFFPTVRLTTSPLLARVRQWIQQQLSLSAITAFGTWPIVGLHFGEINWLGIGVSAAAGAVVELLTLAAASLMLIDLLFPFFAPFVGALIQNIYSLFVTSVFGLAASSLVRHGTWVHQWSLTAAVGWVGCWLALWITLHHRRRRAAVNNWRGWHET